MAIEVIMPQMGESIAEGTVVRWLKKVGDRVHRDEPIFEISTDKVDTEIPSPADGILKEIRVKEGQTVPVQTVVALLGSEEEAEAGASRKPESAPPPPAAFQRAPGPAAAPPAVEDRLRQRSSPLVRRIAREHGLEISRILGTGTGGRVTKKDILEVVEGRKPISPAALSAPTTFAPAALSAPAVPLPQFSPGEVTVEPLSPMRQRIAEHMVLSKRTSPHVTTVFEVDMTEVARRIAEFKDQFLKVHGVKLTYLPFILKAAIGGLREFPVLNAALSGPEVHYFKKVNLGIAVALDDGLIVPIVKNADEKSLVGLAKAVKDLAERARSKKLLPDEVRGGTFTITNHGVFGSLFATPVINQPQVGILGTGAVTRRPVVLPDTDAIAIRFMMYLSLSFDHRLVDGATADRFLAHLKGLLERCPFSPMES
ncbi:MAG: 2-oxo acid dehydrogenase subunit E2 [Planctomycetes bacterium]|nr:2-oxo acid dehydrogenase subunit E2 [Planctomycetota bacterium]